jgi:hypothetical protein
MAWNTLSRKDFTEFERYANEVFWDFGDGEETLQYLEFLEKRTDRDDLYDEAVTKNFGDPSRMNNSSIPFHAIVVLSPSKNLLSSIGVAEKADLVVKVTANEAMKLPDLWNHDIPPFHGKILYGANEFDIIQVSKPTLRGRVIGMVITAIVAPRGTKAT